MLAVGGKADREKPARVANTLEKRHDDDKQKNRHLWREMEGDVTSGVLVIGGEGRDEGEQDEGKGEEGESLQQPKTIQRRERGGGGARNPFTLSQRPLHIISRHLPHG